MFKKSDWEAVYHELVLKGRQRLGEPPTEDELWAYFQGELPEEDAPRIREFLAYYPELVQAFEMPFPFPYEGKPGDADFISEEDLARNWKELQARVQAEVPAVDSPAPIGSREDVSPAHPRVERPAGRPPEDTTAHDPAYDDYSRSRFTWARLGRTLGGWRLAAGLAGYAFALVFGVLYVRSEGVNQQLERKAREPRINPEDRLLLPDSMRGAAEQQPIGLSAEADHFLLTPALSSSTEEFSDYRLDIVDLRAPEPKRIWSGTGIKRQTDDTFTILIPRSFLAPGEYRLELYGLDAGRESLLGTYTIQVPAVDPA